MPRFTDEARESDLPVQLPRFLRVPLPGYRAAYFAIYFHDVSLAVALFRTSLFIRRYLSWCRTLTARKDTRGNTIRQWFRVNTRLRYWKTALHSEMKLRSARDIRSMYDTYIISNFKAQDPPIATVLKFSRMYTSYLTYYLRSGDTKSLRCPFSGPSTE